MKINIFLTFKGFKEIHISDPIVLPVIGDRIDNQFDTLTSYYVTSRSIYYNEKTTNIFITAEKK
jgi:hypothetical protein